MHSSALQGGHCLKFSLWWSFLSGWLFCLDLSAQTLLPPSLSEVRPEREEPSQVLMRLEQSQYLSQSTNTSERNSFALMSLRFNHEGGQTWRKKAEAFGDFAFQENQQPYIAVPELFLKRSWANEGLELTLGRKRWNWSKADSQWFLGLWQPLARWDFFRPVEQGFTGVHFLAEKKHWSLLAFGSGVSLPDQGPQFALTDGQFSSNNRWFWRPQSQIGLFAQESALRYRINRPSEREALLNASWAAKASIFESVDRGLWGSVGYSNKPLNQFHLVVDPGLREDSLEIQINVTPTVVRHQLTTFEAGLKGDRLQTWFSLTRDRPESTNYGPTIIESSLDETLFMSAAFEHPLWGKWFRNSQLTWAYLNSWRRERRKNSSQLGADVESSFDRFPIRHVASVTWDSHHLSEMLSNWRFRTQYWHSFEENGSWVSAGLAWASSPWSVWTLQFDILGSDEARQSGSNNLISRYRNNDRIIGGFEYVF